MESLHDKYKLNEIQELLLKVEDFHLMHELPQIIANCALLDFICEVKDLQKILRGLEYPARPC